MRWEDPIAAGPVVGQPQADEGGQWCAAGGDHRRGDMRPGAGAADQRAAKSLRDDDPSGDRRGRRRRPNKRGG